MNSEVYRALAWALPLLLPLFDCVLFLLLGSCLFLLHLHGSFYTSVFLCSFSLKLCSKDSLFLLLSLCYVCTLFLYCFYFLMTKQHGPCFFSSSCRILDYFLFFPSFFFLFFILLFLSTVFPRCLFSSPLFPEESSLLLSQLPTVTLLSCHFHSLSSRICKSNVVLPFPYMEKKISLFWTISKLTACLPAHFSISGLLPPSSPVILTHLLPCFGPPMCPSNCLLA